ncbi:MAG: hypothetical protein WC503_06215 [Candidatus Shapirobacteria bacterium]
MSAEKSRSILGDATVTPLGARSSMDDVRATTEMNKDNIYSLGVESLAFIYGVAQLDSNTEVVLKIEEYVTRQTGPQGVALRTGMGLVLAESFSDAFLVWNSQVSSLVPPPELQQKTTEWIVEGLTSSELTEDQRALIKPVVINLLGRIGDDVGESILDEIHADTIVEKGGITDQEIETHQQELIQQIQGKTVNSLLREMFGEN